MGRKFKLALAALLGFSAACSSAKHSAGRSTGPQEAIGVEMRSDTTHYRIVLMYGVRPPRGTVGTVLPDSTAGRETPTATAAPAPQEDPQAE
ncbi:MAG: hypothetical protein K2N02_01425 [Alistipes sp.]|nr:hypothetical protein [Alistipes sp.]